MENYGTHRWERLFEAVHELSVLISAGPHREAHILERILRSSQSLLNARFVHLFLVEEGKIRRYVLQREESGKEVLSVQTLPYSANLVNWIQQEQASALLYRNAHPAGERPRWEPGHAGAPISAPLHTGTRSHGVLLVFPRDDVYGSEDASLLSYLANQAAVVLEHAELYRKLETEATTDGLTGLFNYRYFMDALARELSRAERFGESLSLLMIDVDNLKQYNDLYGHLGGSGALQELGDLLREESREIDVAAKYGGDEFSVILPNTSAPGAIAFAERLVLRVEERGFQNDPARKLTVSVGIAVFPDDGRDARELLGRADARLFRAKSLGKNRWSAYDEVCEMGVPEPVEENS